MEKYIASGPSTPRCGAFYCQDAISQILKCIQSSPVKQKTVMVSVTDEAIKCFRRSIHRLIVCLRRTHTIHQGRPSCCSGIKMSHFRGVSDEVLALCCLRFCGPELTRDEYTDTILSRWGPVNATWYTSFVIWKLHWVDKSFTGNLLKSTFL